MWNQFYLCIDTLSIGHFKAVLPITQYFDNINSYLNRQTNLGVLDQVLAELEDDEAGEEVPARQTA